MDQDITAGSIDDVLGRVGTDKDLASAALELEEAKGDDKRTTLIEKLERIVLADDTADGDDDSGGAIGPEVFVATDTDQPVDPNADVAEVGPEVYTIEQ